MSTTNIALLHLWILATQAFYMYLSNKTQLKKHRYLYIIAIPIITAFPVIISSQDLQAYTLYEYAIVFCIIFAAIVDSSLAAAINREYLTDETCRSLISAYFLICVVTSFWGNISISVRMIPAFLLGISILVSTLVKKDPVIELVKSIPLALLSVFCSWAFVRFGL